MAQPTGLAPAGSSTYSSNTLHVGDGTWDYDRDTFLLPNLMGLNFDTMRYNGMGNRFAALSEYHTLILGHGILAVITFLFLIPFAILTASFYHRNPRLALRIHISIMAFTVFLVTVIFILGYFAVGPARSLTNPHHGIGLAIYVLILVQAIGGWIIKTVEKGKVRYFVPLKLMLHQWLGRGIAILGFVQVALGLTLYGSPKVLFILYALWGAFLLGLYFVLTYQNHRRIGMGMGYDDRSSYVTGTATDFTPVPPTEDGRRKHSGLQKAAAAVGLGAAVAAIRRRSSGRHRRTESSSEMLDQHPGSQQPLPHQEHRYDDKFTESQLTDVTNAHRTDHTWRNRLLGGAAGLGAVAAMRNMFGGRRRRAEEHDDMRPYSSYSQGENMNSSVARINYLEEGRPMSGPGYGPPHEGLRPEMSHGSAPYMAGAIPAGAAAADPSHWQRTEERERLEQARINAQLNRPITAGESRLSGESYTDYGEETPRRSRFSGVLGGLGGLAAFGGIRSWMQRRRDNRESRRVSDIHQEGAEGDHNYGDPQSPPPVPPGAPYTDNSPQRPFQPMHSQTAFTEQSASPAAYRRDGRNMTETSLTSSTRHPTPQNIPPPPRAHNAGPAPPIHHDFASQSPVTSYGSPARSNRLRRDSSAHHSDQVVPGPLGGSHAGGMSTEVLPPPPRIPVSSNAGRSRSHSRESAVESPPVSVKINVHNDGRHVTLRRLREEEAAREREARRAERDGVTPQAAAGSSAPYPTGPTRPVETVGSPASLNVPQGRSGRPSPSSPIGPPGTSSVGHDDGGSNAPSDYEKSRRRRRAERARLQQQQQQQQSGLGPGPSSRPGAPARGGQRVDFVENQEFD